MMEGALQSVKAFLTAMASHLSSLIKDQIDSITVEINHVRESLREAQLSWERISQRLDERLSKISSDLKLEREKNVEKRSESFQTNQSVEESEVDDLNSAIRSSNRIQVDEHEFPDS